MQTGKQDIENALQMCECADYKCANLCAKCSFDDESFIILKQ